MTQDLCPAVVEEAASWADLLGPAAATVPAAKDATAKPLSNRARRAALKKHSAAAATTTAAAAASAPPSPANAASDMRSPSVAATAIADGTVATAVPVTTGTASVPVDAIIRANTQRPSAGAHATSADLEGVRTPEPAGGQPVRGSQRGTQVATKRDEALGTSGARAPAGRPTADGGSGPHAASASAEGPFSGATTEQQPPQGTAQAAEAAERKRKAKDMMSLLGF